MAPVVARELEFWNEPRLDCKEELLSRKELLPKELIELPSFAADAALPFNAINEEFDDKDETFAFFSIFFILIYALKVGLSLYV